MPERARLGERRLLRRVRQAHRQEVSVRPGPHGRQAPRRRGGPGGGFGQRVPEVRRRELRTALPRMRLPFLGPATVRPPGRVGVVLLVRRHRALPLGTALPLGAALALRRSAAPEAVLPNGSVPLSRSVFSLGSVPLPGVVLPDGSVPLSRALFPRAPVVLRPVS